MGQFLSLLISMLLFSGVVIGVTGFYANLTDTYDKTSAKDLAFLNKTSQISKTINEDITKKFTNESLFSDPSSDVLFVPKKAVEALTLSFASIGIFTDVTTTGLTAVPEFPIPAFLVSIVVAIVVLFILFKLLSAFNKHDI